MLEDSGSRRAAQLPDPPSFVAPLIVSDLLCQARLELTMGTPARALVFVDQELSRLTVTAEAHARVLDSWSNTGEGDKVPVRPGDVTVFLERFSWIRDAPARGRDWAYGSSPWVRRQTCGTLASA